MTVSKIASKIYQAAKKSAKGVWIWTTEWSAAMKKAWRKVMAKKECTKEIWNQAAAIHTRGQAGLMTLVNRTAAEIDSTDFMEIANHLYKNFLAQQNRFGGASHFGLYLNLLHK